MKLKPIFSYFCILISLLALSACEDRLEYYNDYDIPDGSGNLSINITFPELASSTLGGSRSSGEEIEKIENVFIAVYDTEGELLKSIYFTENEYDANLISKPVWSDVKDTPEDGIQKPSDDSVMDWNYVTTPKVTFNILDLPYGKYRIYAAANVKDLADTHNEDIQTEEGLKKISFDWVPGDIKANNQMFGYFTHEGAQTSTGFDAPTLVFTPKNSAIHAWIRRLASKVTIAFDGRGLKNNVRIYIKSVTIKNLPKSCALGVENSPKGESNFLNTSENLIPWHDDSKKEEDEWITEDVEEHSRMFYNKYITGIDNNTDTVPDPGKDYKDWMMIINSGNVCGSSHTPSADALYFFENNQGDYQGMSQYDKRQYLTGDDNTVGENITNSSQKDFRDKVSDGTFVEVQAYYESSDETHYTRGPIRYRFMLGKNVTYNYDAARNHHFKLTLGFKGWANQPDWHIEYESPEPSLTVPETFRVSYVYNQSHTLPITVSGYCTRVEMEITKNYWAPCDDKGNILATQGSTNENDPTAFRWARSVFTSQHPNYATTATPLYNCTGFLALQTECDANGNIPTNILSNYHYNQGTTAVNALNDYYLGKSTAPDQHYREFTNFTDGTHESPAGKVNDYKVIKNGETSHTLLVPVFTRNKSMIDGTNYSGNNPFEEYDRYAEIKVTAYFEDGTSISKPIKVLQTRRLVNPKGIWRSHNSNAEFHVELATKNIGAGYSNNYVKLKSEGSWSASIDDTEGNGFFKLRTATPGDTTQYVVTDNAGKYQANGVGTKIIGKTDTYVDFYVDFEQGTSTSASTSNCGIITVLYHEDQCVHKIMVRQGYNEPLDIMGKGVKWSSYCVFGATAREGSTNDFDVELTSNPLALGSLIRRGRVTQAFLVSNNGGEGIKATDFSNFPMPFGAYKPVPINQKLKVYSPNHETVEEFWGGANGQTGGVGYVDERGTDANPASAKSMGTFHATVGGEPYIYQVPTYENFQQLDDAEYAFGICYGEGASGTQLDPNKAFGFISTTNSDYETDMGMRGIFVYNRDNANQIFFPIGKYGLGRRRMFNISNNTTGDNHPNTVSGYVSRSWIGTLWYGDTNKPLPLTGNNIFRPMAYNVCYQQGAIYWIDKWVPKTVTGRDTGSMGWDMNYYGFDFSTYTDNNYQDACIIKLVVIDKENN